MSGSLEDAGDYKAFEGGHLLACELRRNAGTKVTCFAKKVFLAKQGKFRKEHGRKMRHQRENSDNNQLLSAIWPALRNREKTGEKTGRRKHASRFPVSVQELSPNLGDERGSGGSGLSLRSDDLDSVVELYTDDNFRQLVVTAETIPTFLGGLCELEDHGESGLV